MSQIEPAPLRIRSKSVIARDNDSARAEKHRQQGQVNDDSAGFDPDLILPSSCREGRHSQSEVRIAKTVKLLAVDENRPVVAKVKSIMIGAPVAIVEDVPVKVVKKKRSLFELLTRKKGEKKEQVGGKSKNIPEANNLAMEENIEGGIKGTFGRRSGNLLKRWASRDAKEMLGFGGVNGELPFSLSNPPERHALTAVDRIETQSLANGLTSCFITPQEPAASGNDHFTAVEEDQFTKVMSQRNWFMKFLNVKPASRVICFNISPVATRKEIIKVWRDWIKYGLIIVEDDRKCLVMRARVGSPNSEFLTLLLFPPD
jgi:hypothetical protein